MSTSRFFKAISNNPVKTVVGYCAAVTGFGYFNSGYEKRNDTLPRVQVVTGMIPVNGPFGGTYWISDPVAKSTPKGFKK